MIRVLTNIFQKVSFDRIFKNSLHTLCGPYTEVPCFCWLIWLVIFKRKNKHFYQVFFLPYLLAERIIKLFKKISYHRVKKYPLSTRCIWKKTYFYQGNGNTCLPFREHCAIRIFPISSRNNLCSWHACLTCPLYLLRHFVSHMYIHMYIKTYVGQQTLLDSHTYINSPFQFLQDTLY